MKQASAIAAKTHPFDLLVEGCETFGYRGEDHVLFLNVPFHEPLARLKKLCPWPQADRGEENVPTKPFHPHITLARIRHPQRFHMVKKEVMKKIGHARFTAHIDRIRLYAMVEEKRQTPLEDFPFAQ